jgi:hypothetical protein
MCGEHFLPPLLSPSLQWWLTTLVISPCMIMHTGGAAELKEGDGAGNSKTATSKAGLYTQEFCYWLVAATLLALGKWSVSIHSRQCRWCHQHNGNTNPRHRL